MTEAEPHKEFGGLWEAGWVLCRACGHEWAAVRPAGLLALECSQCGAMDAAYTDREEVRVEERAG